MNKLLITTVLSISFICNATNDSISRFAQARVPTISPATHRVVNRQVAKASLFTLVVIAGTSAIYAHALSAAQNDLAQKKQS